MNTVSFQRAPRPRVHGGLGFSFRRGLAILLAAYQFASLGCVSLTALREKRLEDVSLRQLEAAGSHDDPRP